MEFLGLELSSLISLPCTVFTCLCCDILSDINIHAKYIMQQN